MELYRSPGVSRRCAKWAKETISSIIPRLPFQYNYSNQTTFKALIRTPIEKVNLLNEEEFKSKRYSGGDDAPFLDFGKRPLPEQYDVKSSEESSDSFYTSKLEYEMDTSLGYWNPIPNKAGRDKPGISSEINICVDTVKKKAIRMMPGLPEMCDRKIERLLFKIALLHEIGHHFTFANFAYGDIPSKDIRDVYILEGLASFFAESWANQEEKIILAEMATHQDSPYRFYQYFKHADVSQLLTSFLLERSNDGALDSFNHVVGAKVNFNGGFQICRGRFDGVIFDWSDKGGSIVAHDFIKALISVREGCYISPKIEMIIGRYRPINTLIVTGKDSKIVDYYGYCPQNIIKMDENRITQAIEKHQDDDPGDVRENTLNELDIDEEKIIPFKNSNTQLDNELGYFGDLTI